MRRLIEGLNIPVTKDGMLVSKEFIELLESQKKVPSFTSTQIDDSSHPLNKQYRFKGMHIWNDTTNRPLWSSGNGRTDAWIDGSGSTVHTPS